jgi:hypothetical protein
MGEREILFNVNRTPSSCQFFHSPFPGVLKKALWRRLRAPEPLPSCLMQKIWARSWIMKNLGIKGKISFSQEGDLSLRELELLTI